MSRAELRAEIARKDIRKASLAKALGLSQASFYQKLKGEREFKESEIQKLVTALGLTAADVNRIFLS